MIPPSFAQRRLWFLERLQGPDAAYHLPIALRLTGPVDVAALRAALADVAERHESLRTVFPDVDGEPVQQILEPCRARPELPLVPVTAELDAAVRAAVVLPFDLERQPPLRATLFRLGTRQAVLLLVLHHIAGDGWSMAPLLRDLSAAYRARAAGATPAFPELVVQYADYTLWQRELLGDPASPDSRYRREAAFWARTLTGVPAPLPLPTDRPRSAVATRQGAAVPLRWDAGLHQRLLELGRQHGCTLGGFNWSSQRLDHGGVRWDDRGSRCRRRRLERGGSGPRIGRCGRRCARRAARSLRELCSGSSGA